MIVISFDDAVNSNNWEEIDKFLSSGLQNPNGCDIKTTFFVSHQYNNYSMVQVDILWDRTDLNVVCGYKNIELLLWLC